MITQRCGTCKHGLPLWEDFYWLNYQQKYDTICKPCRSMYNKKRRAKKRDHYNALNRKYSKELRLKVQEALGGQCAHCGITDHRVLEIDHINGGGRQEQLRIGVYGIRKKILEDSTGYQLLCSNCHTIKTWHEEGDSDDLRAN